MDLQTFLQFVGLCVSMAAIFSAGMVALFRYLIMRRDDEIKRLHERIDAQDKAIAQLHKGIAQLPMMYVIREDWVRFSTAISLRLDKMTDLIYDIKGKGND